MDQNHQFGQNKTESRLKEFEIKDPLAIPNTWKFTNSYNPKDAIKSITEDKVTKEFVEALYGKFETDSFQGEPKQVIVVRKDLNMRKGKIAAQVAHASMKVLLDRMPKFKTDYNNETRTLIYEENSALDKWLNGIFTKIVVSVDSKDELLTLHKIINTKSNIPNALITDCGLTEFHDIPTATCLAIGPDWPETIDKFTSHLKLL